MPELTDEHFTEPIGEENRAGVASWELPTLAYERFMLEEGIPILRGIIGVHDIREIELGDWDRLGGRGAFLYLDGIEEIKGMYILEIPPGGSLLPERHLYHEFCLVFEGRGTTEMWVEGSTTRQVAEWGPGSYFYLPPNVNHRLVNGTNKPVLILASTNAPPLYNMIRDRAFIFGCDYVFPAHYTHDANFLRYNEQLYVTPGARRAQVRSNFYPDIISCQLPLDNQRVPGYRRIQPGFHGFEHDHSGFIAEYPIGRYSRAHHHPAGAVLVCLRGGGYTYNWPVHLGQTPWKEGHGDQVRVLDYVQGGLVAAAPGGGHWFHQHFPVSSEPFRVINYWGGPLPGMGNQNLNLETGKSNNLNIEDGGASIGYSSEDPYIRKAFDAALGEYGSTSAMPDELYRKD